MREHLLGYLLEALDPQEAESVCQSLANDEQLRRELEILRRCLTPLAADAGSFDPPAGLAARTCNYVAAQVETTLVRVPARTSRWSFADMLVAATVLLAVSAVFFPAMQQSRFNAQVLGCQNNFREIHPALNHLAEGQGGMLGPARLRHANEAVAGIVAVDLREKDLIEDQRLVCPGSTLVNLAHFMIPRRGDLQVATGEQLKRIQRTMAGSYGFPLGFLDPGVGQWQPVRLLGRANYAVMADAPSLELAHHQTSNHGARIQNVLFDDGHVRRMRSCRDCPNGDDVFHNEDGELAPGKHLDDAVIAPSEWPLAVPVSW